MKTFDDLTRHVSQTLRSVERRHIADQLEPLRTLLEADRTQRSRRLKITRLRFRGKKTGDFRFADGVNVIRAGNDKGKSSLLKLIHFGLTGKNELKKDVDEWIRVVELEFTLDNRSHHLSVDKSKRPRGFLARGGLSDSTEKPSSRDIVFEFANGKNMQRKLEEFFNRAFRLRALPGTQKDSRKSSDALLDSVTSYRAYVRGFYVNQDRGYVDLVTDGIPYGNLFMKVVGMLLGLRGIDARFTAEARLAHVENALGKEERYFQKLEQDLELRDLATLDHDIERIASYVADLKQRRDRQRSGALATDLDRRLEQVNDQWLASVKALHTLENRISRKETEVEGLSSDLDRLTRAVESRQALGSIRPHACPVCDIRIEDRTRFSESAEEECVLCHEHLPSDHQSPLETLEIRNTELADALSREQQRLEAFRADAARLIARSERTSQERTRLLTRIRASHQGAAELDREIELELRYLGRLEAERDRAAQIVTNERGSRLAELMTEKQILAESLRWIQEKHASSNTQLEQDFAAKVHELCTEIGFPELDHVRMGSQLKPIIVQSGRTYSFSELSPGEKVRFVLAFYLALAMIAGERRDQHGAHPGLLLIDSPGKEEMVSRDFEAVVSLLQLIERHHSHQLQVIVASSLPAIGNATTERKRIFISNDDEPLF